MYSPEVLVSVVFFDGKACGTWDTYADVHELCSFSVKDTSRKTASVAICAPSRRKSCLICVLFYQVTPGYTSRVAAGCLIFQWSVIAVVLVWYASWILLLLSAAIVV